MVLPKYDQVKAQLTAQESKLTLINAEINQLAQAIPSAQNDLELFRHALVVPIQELEPFDLAIKKKQELKTLINPFLAKIVEDQLVYRSEFLSEQERQLADLVLDKIQNINTPKISYHSPGYTTDCGFHSSTSFTCNHALDIAKTQQQELEKNILELDCKEKSVIWYERSSSSQLKRDGRFCRGDHMVRETCTIFYNFGYICVEKGLLDDEELARREIPR